MLFEPLRFQFDHKDARENERRARNSPPTQVLAEDHIRRRPSEDRLHGENQRRASRAAVLLSPSLNRKGQRCC